MTVVSPAGVFLRVNRALCDLLGYAEKELVGRNFQEITHPADLEADLAYARRVLEGVAGNYQLEKRFIGPDGKVIWALLHASLVRGTAGEPLFFVAQLQDFTEHKRAEAAVKEGALYARTLLEVSLDPLVTINAHGKITDVNSATERVTGIPRAELVGTDFADYFTQPERAREGYEMAFAEGKVVDYPLSLRHVSGAVTEVLYNASVYRNSAGEIAGVFAAARDVTAQRKAEREREALEVQNRQLQKSRSLTRMAGAIAHHFNNQLHAVMINLELAQIEAGSSPGLGELLQEARMAAQKAADVSRLMLTYLGQTVAHLEILDLSLVCRDALPMLRAALPASVNLLAELPLPGPSIRASANQVQQVLTNLVTNAWEAGSHGTDAIRLRVRAVSGDEVPTVNRFPADWEPKADLYACLEVADSGCGMTKAQLEQLFEPFFTSKFAGRGLGLPVVLGIIRAHHGVIVVDTAPGRGSLFQVFYPVIGAADMRVPPTGVPRIDRGVRPSTRERPIVLVADDEPAVRKGVTLMLDRLGYSVVTAADGVEAVELFRHHRETIRCVLCDLTMPRMDGWETLEALRGLAPGLPVILVSGYSRDEVMSGEHRETPQAFLSKPFDATELGQVLRRVLPSDPGSAGGGPAASSASQ